FSRIFRSYMKIKSDIIKFRRGRLIPQHILLSLPARVEYIIEAGLPCSGNCLLLPVICNYFHGFFRKHVMVGITGHRIEPEAVTLPCLHVISHSTNARYFLQVYHYIEYLTLELISGGKVIGQDPSDIRIVIEQRDCFFISKPCDIITFEHMQNYRRSQDITEAADSRYLLVKRLRITQLNNKHFGFHNGLMETEQCPHSWKRLNFIFISHGLQ